MTMKKRLFYSNLMMVIAPLIAYVAVSIVFGSILRSILFTGYSEPDLYPGGRDDRLLFELLGADSVTTAIIAVALFLLVIISVVIVISLFLAGKMVKKIIVPLDTLCDGAERVMQGNYDEDIHCREVEELEKVCNAFNEMQHQLKANITKNAVYEQDRKEMLAGISHDLRTPLTSIKSYISGLQDDITKTPEKQRKYLDVVYRKACEMESLLDRLFLFSKLETGNMPFEFRPVSIEKYIVTLLDSLEHDLKKRGALLTLNSDCTDQMVSLDAAQMSRAIVNILDNSVKYNPNRQVGISVMLTPQDDMIRLRVQDDGLGVSDKHLPRLFDSFFRGDESRKDSADGSGLGLAIARNIITAHGGSITAENYNGLTMVIDLPMASAIAKEDVQ